MLPATQLMSWPVNGYIAISNIHKSNHMELLALLCQMTAVLLVACPEARLLHVQCASTGLTCGPYPAYATLTHLHANQQLATSSLLLQQAIALWHSLEA